MTQKERMSAGKLAAGVPCRVIRPITEADSVYRKPELL